MKFIESYQRLFYIRYFQSFDVSTIYKKLLTNYIYSFYLLRLRQKVT